MFDDSGLHVYPGQGLLSDRTGKGREILLVFPDVEKRQKILYPPLDLLALAATLIEAGYTVHIMDMRLSPKDWTSVEPRTIGMGKGEDWWVENAGDLLFIGIDARPGLQVELGMRFARRIRMRHPDVPIVWGGWFPSTVPEFLVERPEVDLVVIGEADFRIVEIAKKFEDGEDPREVDGVAWLGNGGRAVVRNPRHFIVDASKTPRMPFWIVPIEAYLKRGGVMIYNSSRGCTGRCTFCISAAKSGSAYSAYPASRVVEELSWIENQYHPENIWIVDFNFFDNMKRALQIADGLMREGFNTKWMAFARVDQFYRFPEEALPILEKAGCRMVSLGIESGSQRVLDRLNKRITVEQTRKVVEKLAGTGISIYANIILGTPGEDWDDIVATLDLVEWISRMDPENVFAFYPMTPLWGTKDGEALLMDYELWKKNPLRTFSSMVSSFTVPSIYWLDKKQADLDAALTTLYLDAAYNTRMRFSLSLLKHPRAMNRLILSRLSRFRLKRRFFAFPVEWKLFASYLKISERLDRLQSWFAEVVWRYRMRRGVGFSGSEGKFITGRRILDMLVPEEISPVKKNVDSSVSFGNHSRTAMVGEKVVSNGLNESKSDS